MDFVFHLSNISIKFGGSLFPILGKRYWLALLKYWSHLQESITGLGFLNRNSCDLWFKLKQLIRHIFELIILGGHDRVNILSLLIHVLLEFLEATQIVLVSQLVLFGKSFIKLFCHGDFDQLFYVLKNQLIGLQCFLCLLHWNRYIEHGNWPSWRINRCILGYFRILFTFNDSLVKYCNFLFKLFSLLLHLFYCCCYLTQEFIARRVIKSWASNLPQEVIVCWVFSGLGLCFFSLLIDAVER